MLFLPFGSKQSLACSVAVHHFCREKYIPPYGPKRTLILLATNFRANPVSALKGLTAKRQSMKILSSGL